MAFTPTWKIGLLVAAAAVLATGCPANSSSSQEPGQKEAAAMATPNDNGMATVLQMTLDSKGLDKYFHIDERPQRKPLRILSNPAVPSDIQLVKFGEPVVWTTAAESADLPVFEFTAVKLEQQSASVSFRYPPEGITGTVTFTKQGDSWTIADTRIVEK